jgi:hypothetical protein
VRFLEEFVRLGSIRELDMRPLRRVKQGGGACDGYHLFR